MKVVKMGEIAKEVLTNPLFTGREVTRQALLPESKEYQVNIVNFGKGVRNKFHAHESEQILIITVGKGVVATEKEEKSRDRWGHCAYPCRRKTLAWFRRRLGFFPHRHCEGGRQNEAIGGLGANRSKETKKWLVRVNSSRRPKGRCQFHMDEGDIIIQLEELAKKFDVQIRYEDIKQDENLTFVAGGLCLYSVIEFGLYANHWQDHERHSQEYFGQRKVE